MIAQKLSENAFLCSYLWQSTAFITVGLVSSFALRRRPCRAHHILLLSVIAAVIVPIATASIKHFGLGLFTAEPEPIRLPVEEESVDTKAAELSLADTEGAQLKSTYEAAPLYPASFEVRPQSDEFPWRSALLWGWAATSLLLTLRLAFSFAMGIRLLRKAVPAGSANIREATRLAEAKLGIEQKVHLYTNHRVRSPIIWCWSSKPTLLVPSSAGEDDGIDWVSVLCHELAHHKRRDHIAGLFAELAVCALPWQMLLWLAKRRLLRLSERACDDWVLACGRPSADYAESLLDLLPQAQMAFVPAVLRTKNGLADRVRRILRNKCGNPRSGLLWVLAVCTVTACIGLGVALAQTRPAKTNSPAKSDEKPAKSFHEAAADGDIRLVKSLLSAGADINAMDELKYTPLHHAAENGHAKLAEFLIAKGADLEARNHYGRTPLALAACRGHKQMVEFLIAKGADVNTKDIWYKRLLHHAAENGHSELARFLIDRSADIESKTNLDYTALNLAVSNGHVQMVELLISKGADVNPKEQKKYTPLHYAASGGHYEIAKLLIAAGADVDVVDSQDRTPLYKAVMSGHDEIAGLLVKEKAYVCFPALHFAAFMGDLDKVKTLIEEGADIDSKDSYGETPLFFAVRAGNRNMVEFLLDSGADIKAKNNGGRTVLHHVARYGGKDMAELLISRGAEVNVIAAKGAASNTPLDHAVLTGRADVTAVLLDNGADPDIQGYCNVMPLHRAAQKGRLDLARMLLAHGANVNIKGGSIEITPLHWAAGPDHAEMAELLIANGADVNAKDKNGETPLHYAASRNGSSVAKILIDKGADVNARDNRGRTPLHDAASGGRKETAQILIAGGADVNAKDKKDRTPLSWAQEKGHKETVELLLRHGAKQ